MKKGLEEEEWGKRNMKRGTRIKDWKSLIVKRMGKTNREEWKRGSGREMGERRRLERKGKGKRERIKGKI